MRTGCLNALRVSLVSLLSAASSDAIAATDSAFGADSIRALITARQFAPAEARARDLAGEVERSAPIDSLRLGEFLNLQSEAMWRAGRVRSAEAESVAARAVAIRRQTVGPDHLDFATSLHNQTNMHRIAGRLDGLDAHYRTVEAIRVTRLGPEHPDVARTCNDHGNLRNLIGDYAGAESLYTRACGIYERRIETQRRNVAACLNNLALLAEARGNYAQARVLLERSLDLFTQALGPDHTNVALACVNLARILTMLGENQEARRLLERGLEIHVRALGADHADVAWNLRELGSLHARSDDLTSARLALERAITVHEQTLGPGHTETALDLFQLAGVAEAAGRDSEAVVLYRRALAINEQVLGPTHPRTAQNLMGLARLDARQGDLDGARQHLERSRAIRRGSLGADHPLCAETERELGNVHLALGDTAAAFESALAAEAIAREHFRLLQQSLPERLALSLAGERITGLDLAVSVALASPGDLHAERVADAIIRSRAIVLDEMVQRVRLAAESEAPGLDTLVRQLSSARERLSNLTLRAPDREPVERYRSLRETARLERERAERALAEASRHYRDREQQREAGLDQVRAALPARSVLVSYRVVDQLPTAAPNRAAPGRDAMPERAATYIACVVRSDGSAPTVVELGGTASVDSLAELAWRQIAGASGLPAWRLAEVEREYRVTGSALRRMVWDPVKRHIGASERVLIVPDGTLSLVDFSALPDSAGYLVEQGPMLHYLSSERVLAFSPPGGTPGRGLLAVGGPDFGAQPGGSGRSPDDAPAPWLQLRGGDWRHDEPCTDQLPTFAPLPRAAREATSIQDSWERYAAVRDSSSGGRTAGDTAIVLTGRAATEDAFRRLAPGRRVLHLATHGFVLGDRCLDGAATGESGVHPETRSTLGGLAFTGANRRSGPPNARDGILTAEEIAGLDLCGVEWTVLSACNTGLGEVRHGEGVFGLRRAFEVAGCHTLIMSLWPVADETAREWMAALYDARLARGLDTAQAMRLASRSMLEQRRARQESTHPWCWAGFIAAGDWR